MGGAGTPVAGASISPYRPEPTMTSRRFSTLAATLAGVALAACSSTSGSGSRASPDVDTAVVVLPTSGAVEQMRAGCWATFYDERNAGGDSLTLIGPVVLQSLDKGSAQQLRRDIKSLTTGPRATLEVYDKQFLSARSVVFQPNSSEGSVVEKLGFGGRIESMRLSCR
jgi:hypothetical protein